MSESAFKILITDDDEDLRDLLTEAVRNWGYTVSAARDGSEALKHLMVERYDIVISDLMMPGIDGLALLKRIKEIDRDIMVVIITGYATIETAIRAIESGAYDYIAKPFRLDELMIVIKNACERIRLSHQNKMLLEEIRNMHSEIGFLKDALSRAHYAEPPVIDVYAVRDRPNVKQQEYLKEAERFSRYKPYGKD